MYVFFCTQGGVVCKFTYKCQGGTKEVSNFVCCLLPFCTLLFTSQWPVQISMHSQVSVFTASHFQLECFPKEKCSGAYYCLPLCRLLFGM